jgi:hypothetical protein
VTIAQRKADGSTAAAGRIVMRKINIRSDKTGYTVVVYDKRSGRWFEAAGPFKDCKQAEAVMDMMTYADKLMGGEY